MPRRNFYVKDSELDDYQVKIINKRTDNSFIVKGCAGSGKSILALWKAKQIQNESKGSYQIIVFTKALKQYMADGISQVGINSRNVDYLWHYQNRSGCPSSDYIIVDEAQDFSKEDILLFKSKAKKLYYSTEILHNNYTSSSKIKKRSQWKKWKCLQVFKPNNSFLTIGFLKKLQELQNILIAQMMI
jgi:superfamily I DNA and RNA helicase